MGFNYVESYSMGFNYAESCKDSTMLNPSTYDSPMLNPVLNPYGDFNMHPNIENPTHPVFL